MLVLFYSVITLLHTISVQSIDPSLGKIVEKQFSFLFFFIYIYTHTHTL